MRQFSAEEREAIMQQARENIAKRPEPYVPPPPGDWQPAEPERLDEPPRRLDTPAVDWAEIDRRIVAVVDQHICESVINERAFLLEVVAQALGESLADARHDAAAELADKVRALRTELAQAQATIADLRVAVAELRIERARSTVIDLPNPVAPRRVN
jgi:hypothetical protein